jgi:hypothetical protein
MNRLKSLSISGFFNKLKPLTILVKSNKNSIKAVMNADLT